MEKESREWLIGGAYVLAYSFVALGVIGLLFLFIRDLSSIAEVVWVFLGIGVVGLFLTWIAGLVLSKRPTSGR